MDIKELQEYSLSDTDLQKICGKTNIIRYPDLKNYNNIDEILDDKGRAILLFLTIDDHTGHWIGILKQKDGIHYFDPYGTLPEGEKKWITKNKLIELDEEEPYLTELLQKSGYDVYANIYDFQEDKAGINDCGRWVATRLKYYKKSLKDFYKMVKKSNIDEDDYITKLTYNIIKK